MTGHLFSRPTSQNPNVFSSAEFLLKINLSTDHCSTPATPNSVDYPLIVNNTLVPSSRQNPRSLYRAPHKLNSDTQFSDNRRCNKFHRLDTTNLDVKAEITVKFHNLSPHAIISHLTVNFKSLPYPFIATNLNLFVSDHPPFSLLHNSITS